MSLDFESIIADPAAAFVDGEIGMDAAMQLLQVDRPDQLASMLEHAGLTAPEADGETIAPFRRR